MCLGRQGGSYKHRGGAASKGHGEVSSARGESPPHRGIKDQAEAANAA